MKLLSSYFKRAGSIFSNSINDDENLTDVESGEEKKIQLYALSTCAHCSSLKHMLEMSGNSYTCVDVDLLESDKRREVLQEVRQYNKRCSFPTTVIGGKVIVGYRETEIKAALGLL